MVWVLNFCSRMVQGWPRDATADGATRTAISMLELIRPVTPPEIAASAIPLISSPAMDGESDNSMTTRSAACGPAGSRKTLASMPTQRTARDSKKDRTDPTAHEPMASRNNSPEVNPTSVPPCSTLRSITTARCRAMPRSCLPSICRIEMRFTATGWAAVGSTVGAELLSGDMASLSLVPIEDLLARPHHNPLASEDVVVKRLNILDAVGDTRQVGVDRNRHHSGRLRSN